MKTTHVVLASNFRCAGGTDSAILDVVSGFDTKGVDGQARAELTVAGPQHEDFREGNTVRVEWDDGSWDEWRIGIIDATVSKGSLMYKAQLASPLFDLNTHSGLVREFGEHTYFGGGEYKFTKGLAPVR